MATADALTEVHLMFMATLGEMVWGTDRATDGWRQGKGQQESTPLAPPPALAADYLWSPTLAGQPNGEDHLDHGAINACRLLKAADFNHVALSA